MSKYPLEGVRIVDFTRAYAGTFCTRVLGDLGAEVIKVEAIQRPDLPCRKLGYIDNDPGDEPWNRGGYFHYLNMNKLGVTINMDDPRGIEIIKRLIKDCDIVTENYSPRVMSNFGLDYESLKKIKSDIIMVSMSGYGQVGPYKDRVAYGPMMDAAGGISSVTGYEDGEAVKILGLLGDWILGMYGASSAMMAYYSRNRTGKGQRIDVAGREALVTLLGPAVLDYSFNERVWGRIGNRHPYYAPHGCYPCKGEDQWLAIAVTSEEEWESLCKATGNSALPKDERFSNMRSRLENQDDLDKVIEEWTRTQNKVEAMQLLQKAGVPAGAVHDSSQVTLDPHLKDRGFFQVVDHPLAGKRPIPKQLPAIFSSFEGTPTQPAPLLGEHNNYVLKTLLGMSDEDIATLEAEKIIGTVPTYVFPKEKEKKAPISYLVEKGAARFDPDFRERINKQFGITE